MTPVAAVVLHEAVARPAGVHHHVCAGEGDVEVLRVARVPQAGEGDLRGAVGLREADLREVLLRLLGVAARGQRVLLQLRVGG